MMNPLTFDKNTGKGFYVCKYFKDCINRHRLRTQVWSVTKDGGVKQKSHGPLMRAVTEFIVVLVLMIRPLMIFDELCLVPQN